MWPPFPYSGPVGCRDVSHTRNEQRLLCVLVIRSQNLIHESIPSKARESIRGDLSPLLFRAFHAGISFSQMNTRGIPTSNSFRSVIPVNWDSKISARKWLDRLVFLSSLTPLGLSSLDQACECHSTTSYMEWLCLVAQVLSKPRIPWYTRVYTSRVPDDDLWGFLVTYLFIYYIFGFLRGVFCSVIL